MADGVENKAGVPLTRHKRGFTNAAGVLSFELDGGSS
jgi:hypothetical protein